MLAFKLAKNYTKDKAIAVVYAFIVIPSEPNPKMGKRWEYPSVYFFPSHSQIQHQED